MKKIMAGLKCGAALLVAALAMTGSVSAQIQIPVDPPTPSTIAGHLAKVKAIAGEDPFLKKIANDAYWCQSPSAQARTLLGELKAGTPIAVMPVQVFDNLWMIGTVWDGVYILKTSAGLVMWDSLDNPREVKDIMLPSMKFLGLDPKDIKLDIITHGHGDHYGGSRYLQDTYHTPIGLSDADWRMIPKAGADGVEPPKRDRVLADGEKITIGDATIQIVLTRGHTPGTVSSIIPVKDHGVSRVMVMWGGTAYPDNPAAWSKTSDPYPGADGALALMDASMTKLQNAGLAAGAEGIVSNHPGFSYMRERLAQADPNGPNPLVGKEQMTKTFDIMHECLAAERDWVAARQGS